MEEVFITKIHIDQIRHLRDITIELDSEKRKHLILTGKNGSGKTSVLEGLAFNLQMSPLGESNLTAKKDYSNYQKILIDFSTNNNPLIASLSSFKNFLLKFFPAKRTLKPQKPTGIVKLNLSSYPKIGDSLNENFLQYLVNLKAEKAFAKDDGENGTVKAIDRWFENIERSLKDLFDDSNLELIFDRKEYNFFFRLGNGNTVTFSQLPDGYSSVLNIITELMIRMENETRAIYNLQGIVLIDELETHLHIDLQKKILPFLTAFFPKIQFIVTTHSPFVINSVEDAVVFDLENKIRIEDATGYSYDTIVESYFGADKYSMKVKEDVERFEELSFKNDLSAKEERELSRLDHFFKTIPLAYAPELEVKLQQIKLKKLIPQANGQRH